MRTFRKGDYQYIRYRGDLIRYEGEYLPHWEVEDGIYFVTFRLKDSIPKDVLVNLRDRYHGLMSALRSESGVSPGELSRIGFDFFLEDVDQRLDEARGECLLRQERIAQVMARALEFFDGEKYRLFAWCIMPNHVHVAIRKINGYRLHEIAHSWKSYTANVANELTGNTGEPFWHADYYDRLVRTVSEFENVCQYIVRNPVDAGLEDWKWVGVGDFGGPLT